MSEHSVESVQASLAELHDPAILAVNERHGDDHAVNLTKLRAVAKAIKTNPELAVALWDTGDSESRLVALLISRPRQFSAADLDAMIRDTRIPKVRDWLINYVIAKSPYREELRQSWYSDPDVHVRAASWALTAIRLRKRDIDGLDPEALLADIETHMKDAPKDLQWEMNNSLAYIGIEQVQYRARALDIGERLEVLKDYPTPPNCTSPYAPTWINEMVSRQG